MSEVRGPSRNSKLQVLIAALQSCETVDDFQDIEYRSFEPANTARHMFWKASPQGYLIIDSAKTETRNPGYRVLKAGETVTVRNTTFRLVTSV